jgi:hypothetical protein
MFIFFNSFPFVNFKYSSFAVVLFACERIPAMGAPAAIFIAVWRNPPLGRRCVAESGLFENVLNAARHCVSARSYFVAAWRNPPWGRHKIIENEPNDAR